MNKLNHRLPLKLLVIIQIGCFGSPQAIAEIYKWVDENGKVHFSDKPINDKSKQVQMKRQPSEQEIQQAKERAARVIQHQRKLNEIRSEEASEVQQANAKRDKLAAELCRNAKQEMKYMNGKYVNYTTNEKGERYYLTDQEKNELAAELEKVIAENCTQAK